MNKKIFNTFFTTSLISAALVLPGCGGGGSSSSGGVGGTATATVPANAVVINNSNAEPTVQSGSSSANSVNTAIGAETPANADLKDKLDIVNKIILDHTVNSGTTLATSVVTNCTSGGTITVTGSSSSGTATFSACVEYGFTINGSFTYNRSTNSSTGVYSRSATGDLTMEDSTNGIKFNFSGLDYAENGNDFDYTYTISKLTFSVDFTSSSTSGGGFLFEVKAPIVDSTVGYYDCPTSGDVLITGANGTTAEGIYNGDGTMTIKANGSVVNAAATCYY